MTVFMADKMSDRSDCGKPVLLVVRCFCLGSRPPTWGAFMYFCHHHPAIHRQVVGAALRYTEDRIMRRSARLQIRILNKDDQFRGRVFCCPCSHPPDPAVGAVSITTSRRPGRGARERTSGLGEPSGVWPQELVKKLFARVGAGPEAQASGYPNEALTGCWVRAAGLEPASFG